MRTCCACLFDFILLIRWTKTTSETIILNSFISMKPFLLSLYPSDRI